MAAAVIKEIFKLNLEPTKALVHNSQIKLVFRFEIVYLIFVLIKKLK